MLCSSMTTSSLSTTFSTILTFWRLLVSSFHSVFFSMRISVFICVSGFCTIVFFITMCFTYLVFGMGTILRPLITLVAKLVTGVILFCVWSTVFLMILVNGLNTVYLDM